MSLAYALPFFCDAMLYFGALGCFGLLRRCRATLWWVPALLLGACWLSHRLMGHRKRWLRWAPMAVVIPCLIVVGNWPGRLASLPMLAYLPLYVFNNRRAMDYDYAADRFRHSLIVAGVVLLFAMLFDAEGWKQGLPWLFLYFTLNMALLRLLRHDDAVARSRRFRAINLTGVALVCAAGFGLSQPAIIAALKAAWLWFAEHVLLNILALVFYVIQAILYAGAWLISRIPGLAPEGGIEMPAMMGAEGSPDLAEAAAQTRTLPPWVRYAVQAVGVLLLALVVVALLRALSRRVARSTQAAGTDEREALDDEAPSAPRGLGLRRAPDEGVRRWYRRALVLLRARGGRVTRTMNTLQIHRENATPANEDALAELRAAYLPVRYGEKTAGPDDVRRAKAAYEKLKKA